MTLPDAAMKLALLASLAARIEPELLRKLRLELLPGAGADAEADFWFSDLVEARSPSWLVLSPEAAETLRERCRAEVPNDEQERACRIIAEAHQQASSLVRLEDELHRHTMRGDEDAVDEILQSIIAALRGDDALPVARWALRTLPRLSTWVRERPAAWAVRLIADQQLGHVLRIDPAAANVPPEVWPLLKGALTQTEIWARVIATPPGVELSREPLLGSSPLTVPLTDPLMVQISERQVIVPREGSVYVPTLHAAVYVQGLDGSLHILTPHGTPRKSVHFRYLLLCCMHAVDGKPTAVEDAIARELEQQPVDAIFFVGGLTARNQPKQFKAAAERLQRLQRKSGNPPLFILPGVDEDEHQWAAMAARIDPPQMRRGTDLSAFAATLVHHGARIGVVGIRNSDHGLAAESLCGSLKTWNAAHHVSFLLMSSPEHDANVVDAFPVVLVGRDNSVPPVKSVLALRLSDPMPSQIGWITGEFEIDAVHTTGHAMPHSHEAPDSAAPRHRFQYQTVQLTRPRPAIPREWVLVAGAANKLRPDVPETARALGRNLAAAGYGLATGGWPGVDEETTAGYAEAFLGAPDALHNVIRHYVGRVEPRASMPGRRLFLDTDHRAVERSVREATAVVLIAGLAGTEWIGEEALRQQRRLLTIPVTGGAAAKLGGNLPLPPQLRDPNATPQQLAAAVVDAIRNPVQYAPAESRKPAFAPVPPRKSKGGTKKKSSSSKGSFSSKRSSKKK